MSQRREGSGSFDERGAGGRGGWAGPKFDPDGSGYSSEEASVACGPDICPAGMCQGRGHVVVYSNPALVGRFGPCLGMPAREVMVGLPTQAFELLDAVYERARPLARWVMLDGERWRMTAVPRVDAESGEVFGVSFHLRSQAGRAQSE